MKRNYLKMAFVCLFAVAALCSCGKDENGEEQDYSISIEVEDGASYSETVYTVKATTSDGSVTLASVSYNNGRFTLNLPGSLNAQSSNDLDEIPESITVSNRNVNGLHVSLETYGESSNEITGNLYLVSGDWRGGLMYVDGNVNITGSYTDEAKKHTLKYNMNLIRGWNIVYVKTVLKEDGWIEEEWASTVSGVVWRVVARFPGDYPEPPDDNPNEDDDGGDEYGEDYIEGGEENCIITVVVKNGSSYSEKIDIVKAVFSGATLASVPYNRGVFTLTLPANLSEYAGNEISESLTVSNPNAKLCYAFLHAYKSDSKVGEFFYKSGDDIDYAMQAGSWHGYLTYADGDVNIRGTHTEIMEDDQTYTYTYKYNMHIKKGWNIMHVKMTSEAQISDTNRLTEYEITAKVLPARTTWYFDDARYWINEKE